MVIENGILEYIEKGEYAPKTNLEYVERENVALVVKYLDNYLFLSWNKVAYQKSLVTGGIECGETKEEAARREVIEETGYMISKQLFHLMELMYQNFMLNIKTKIVKLNIIHIW